MDVTFTNVLEGARQYFQGLPAASSSNSTTSNSSSTVSTAGPASFPHHHQRYQQPVQHHPQQHELQQQQQQRQTLPNHPPSTSYWPPPVPPAPAAREPIQPQPPTINHQRPPSHHSAAHPPSPYEYQYHQFSRPHSRETPQPPSSTNNNYYPNYPVQTQQYNVASSNYQRYYTSQGSTVTTNGMIDVKVNPSTSTYKAVTSQTYPSHNSQTNYYKHIYTSSQARSNASTKPSDSVVSVGGGHHLPPTVAADLSVNYPNHSRVRTSSTSGSSTSSTTAASVNSSTNNSINRQRTSLASSYRSNYYPNQSHYYGSGSSASVSGASYSNSTSSNASTNVTVTTQSYNVIMSTSNTLSYQNSGSQSSSYMNHNSYYSNSVGSKVRSSVPPVVPQQHHQPQPQTQPPPPQTIVNNGTKQKRESPLDLSVKTVRTSADSTNETGTNQKYYQGLSTHSYPTYDVNHTFQRNICNQNAQSAVATAPKVDFNPNFSMNQRSAVPPTNNTIYGNSSAAAYSSSTSNRYPTMSLASAAQVNSYINAGNKKAEPMMNMYEKKRPAPAEKPPPIPNKIPKIDPWQQKFNEQIEEKFSNYYQEQKQKIPNQSTSINHFSNQNGNDYHLADKKPNLNQYYPHYYSQYQNANQSIPPPYGRPPPKPSVPMGTGADKRVLSLLRNSLEVKEQKKLEQLKTEVPRSSDVPHPTTDVTAPLQPKLGFVSRNNVSPFTPTSFPDNATNLYKLHLPKAIDSINYDLPDNASLNNIKSEKKLEGNNALPNQVAAMATQGAGEFDGLAAFLAARIRTKGELKQGNIVESVDANKPKIKKECGLNNDPTPPPPRRRLFSKNEDQDVPPRDKTRSSSETSVFDFPDSDSENDTPVKLGAMRRERRSSLKAPAEIKVEALSRPVTPENDAFAELCDTFVEQLKNGVGKKKPKRRKATTPDNSCSVSPAEEDKEPSNSLENEIKLEIKVELVKEDIEIKKEVTEEDNLQAKEQNNTLENKNQYNSENEADGEEDDDDVIVSPEKHKKCRRILSSSESDSDSEIDSKKKKPKDVPLIIRPAKKPNFGDGSDFYPGWEEGVYKYKKSLRMPPSLIQVTRPPQFHRLSTSLPDLDPCPISPTPSSVTTENTDYVAKEAKSRFKKIKSEPIDSDDSNCSFNLFRQSNYDSEGSSSVKSLPTGNNNSITDRLLQKYGGGKKKRKYTKSAEGNPKIIPKAENPIELLPTPSLEIKKEEVKKLPTPVIKAESPLLGFRKKTINNFKDAFINSNKNILGVNEQFATVVLNSRTRKETRILKQRATIKEVFGEDRPASAPPITCVNDMKDDSKEDETSLADLVRKNKKEIENTSPNKDTSLKNKLKTSAKNQKNLLKTLVDKKLKDKKLEKEIQENKEVVIKVEPLDIKEDKDDLDTRSLNEEGDDTASNKKKNKFRNIRRKFSSGFDYIRKKKKAKKEDEAELKQKRRGPLPKTTPESVQDIQKEIKTWVLNKGVGETHLHRAARLGYADVTAYCLEKMDCMPSPKDNAGYTPLHEACSRGHLDIAKLLLLFGANASESAQGGIRPLHEAVENGYVEIVRLLLSYGADPTLATYSGLTPLTLANDEVTLNLIENHLRDIKGELSPVWQFTGPASCFDPIDWGYNIFDDVPDDCESAEEDDDIEFEMSDTILPNLYTLRGEPQSDRWVLLQDLSNLLKIKSRDALLRQIQGQESPSSSSSNRILPNRSILRELKMTDFLEQAHCCQFLNIGEKINTRASKIALIKYTDRVKELLNVESVVITAR